MARSPESGNDEYTLVLSMILIYTISNPFLLLIVSNEVTTVELLFLELKLFVTFLIPLAVSCA